MILMTSIPSIHISHLETCFNNKYVYDSCFTSNDETDKVGKR